MQLFYTKKPELLQSDFRVMFYDNFLMFQGIVVNKITNTY